MNFLKEKIDGKYSATRVLLLISTVNFFAMLWYMIVTYKEATFPETFGSAIVMALPLGLLVKELKKQKSQRIDNPDEL